MILINRAYSEVTPESAADSDTSDCGMIAENVAYSFRELVRLLRDHSEASCYPATGGTFEWYGTGYSVDDYRTGTEREETAHYSRDNPPRCAKYWRKAAIAAGIVKGGA